MNLIEQLGDSQSVLLILPNETYTKNISDIAKQLSGRYESICYVSLNRIYTALAQSLEHEKIDLKKFCFVDCVTKTVLHDFKPTENIKLVSSASAITELSVAVSTQFSERKFNCLLFDSLSTLLIYMDSHVLLKFVHSLLGKSRINQYTTILTALENDSDSLLVNDLGLFVDKVVHLNK